ncbi:hypothetical protein [Scytonema sp. PCC 10023]|uniref:hypothetical protein n=1 Tax=Scytonema sp. PCC 10023 TaxID=1680591 RepID=UPI0039C71522
MHPKNGKPKLQRIHSRRQRDIIHTFGIQGTRFFNGLSFTDEPGVWKRTGEREITARCISFDYLPPSNANKSGQVVATADYTYIIAFNADFNQLSSTYTGVGYPPDVNPLAPFDAKPLFTSSGSYQGQRIMVK